jgi:hypothetical protein
MTGGMRIKEKIRRFGITPGNVVDSNEGPLGPFELFRLSCSRPPGRMFSMPLNHFQPDRAGWSSSSSHYDRWGGGTLQIVIAPVCHCEER